MCNKLIAFVHNLHINTLPFMFDNMIRKVICVMCVICVKCVMCENACDVYDVCDVCDWLGFRV